MIDQKPWWKSKTLWFNLFVALMAMAATQTAALAQLLSPNVYAVVSIGVAGINAVLRLVTVAELTLK